MLIVEGLCQGFRLVEVARRRPNSSRGNERRAQVKPEVDGLLKRIVAFREILQRFQRLLEARHRRLVVGRARQCLGARLTEIRRGHIPDFTPEGMVRQPFDLVGPTVSRELSIAATMRP